MASTFSQIKSGLDEISDRNKRNREHLARARDFIVKAQTDLAAMPGEYTSLVQDINQAAIDNPTDQAFQLAKSEKDKLVANFNSLKSYCDDLLAAFDAVNE